MARHPGPRADGPADRTILVRRLGLMDYAAALDCQQAAVEARRSGTIGDTLLLVEHPAVITLGARNRAGVRNIVSAPDVLRGEGIALFETGRGGDVTYHGPGQLVGYPIFDLRPDRCDVHQYVRDIEEALITALAGFGVDAGRLAGMSGVWVGGERREEKIAAVGVRISRWITSHGFALNVATNLDHFRHIVPCGIRDHGVTSLDRLLGRRVAMGEVEDAVVSGIESVFASPRR